MCIRDRICSLALSLYGVVVPHFGVRSNNWNLVRSVQHASILSFLMISVASAVLMEALINSDFSIEYVWGHSSRDMPLFYKITSFWGGLEGSLLFWILVQSFFIMIVAFRYQYTNREIIPYVLATLNGIMSFLLILLIGWSNPLELQACNSRGFDHPISRICLLYTSPSPRDRTRSRMPSSA